MNKKYRLPFFTSMERLKLYLATWFNFPFFSISCAQLELLTSSLSPAADLRWLSLLTLNVSGWAEGRYASVRPFRRTLMSWQLLQLSCCALIKYQLRSQPSAVSWLKLKSNQLSALLEEVSIFPHKPPLQPKVPPFYFTHLHSRAEWVQFKYL